MKPEFKTTAVYMAEMRVKSKLSQGKVAKALGHSSPQMVSNWERGMCHPPAAAIKRLAKMFNVPKREIIGRMSSDYVTYLEERSR